MYFEDLGPAFKVRKRELNLPVNSARSAQGRVENIRPIRGHKDFYVPPSIESVHLVDDLEHGSLDLIVTASTVVMSDASDGVNLVEKYDASLFGSSQLENLPDHPGSLSHVFLNQFGSNHSNETVVGPIGHRFGG